MNAENPADMIEVSRVIFAEMTKRTSAGWSGTSMSDALAYGDALHAAGLLADPADRDEDAIKRAVEIIARMSWEGPKQEWPLWGDATEADRQRIREKVQPIAETLADEALLTNPDEFVSSWAAGKERARAERAEAERDQLRRWKAEAIPVMLGLQDLGKALGVRLGTRITGEAAAEQARALKAERDHAKEALALAEKDRRTYHRDALRAEAEVADLVAEGIRQKRRANDAIAERDELRATVERVRQCHQPHACTGFPECTYVFGGQCAYEGDCDQCRTPYPCPTIRALDGGGQQ